MEEPQTQNSEPATVFSPLVEHAIELAAEWHDRTYRKGRWRPSIVDHPDEAPVRVPVITHLTTVALTVQRAGWPDEVVAAAFLHDSLEDANTHDERLERDILCQRVGDEVTRLVEAVTEKKVDAEGRPRPWQARKEDYLRQLKEEPPEALAISLADKLHNLWTICESLEAGTDVFEGGPGRTALSAGPEEQEWFHRRVLDVTSDHSDERLARLHERLGEELDRFERLADEGSQGPGLA